MKMIPRLDLTGQKFGRLTAIEPSYTNRAGAYWVVVKKKMANRKSRFRASQAH